MHQRQIDAVRGYSDAVAELRAAGITRSARVTGDVGEWYAEVLFGGVRATKQTQKGWDLLVEATGEKLQVKAQRFDKDNRWNYLDGDPALFTHLVVILLNDAFRLRAVYKVPSAELATLLRTERPSGKRSYHWSDLEPWRVNLATHARAQPIKALVAEVSD